MRSRLRRIMRGYRFLKSSNSLNVVGGIDQAFTNYHLNIKQEHFSKFIFGCGIEQAEIICRQYLLLRCAGLSFNKSLLYALGKSGSPIVHYLPIDWRKIIQKCCVNVASLRTALLWNAFIIMMLTYGFLIIARIIQDSIYALFSKPKQPLGSYAYFNALSAGNIPQLCSDGRSHDIVTWYMQWDGRNPAVNMLCHGVKGAECRSVNGTPVIHVSFIIPPITRCSSIARFITWGIWASLIAALDLLRGRWWHALLLNQAALAAQVRFQDPTQLAKDYLFHNSGWFFRPLWTYEAERHGARVIFYFYSTNCEPFKRNDGYPPMPYGWQAMNWPRYLVWDKYQADFVRRAVGSAAIISIVGPIWFHSSAVEIPAINVNNVSVFDVTPHRASSYQVLGLDFEYYLPETSIPFLDDIQNTCKIHGYQMIWKKKRKIGKIAHPQYRFFAEKLSRYGHVDIVNPDISAHRVIEASSAVISMPFTSTALIARDLGKPTCYYDPSGLVQKDDRAAHGIEIIIGPEELSAWLKAI